MKVLDKLEALYRRQAHRYSKDPKVKKDVDSTLRRLQSKKEPMLLLLHRMISIVSLAELQRIYRMLDVKLSLEDICAESFYAGIPPITQKELDTAPQMALLLDGLLPEPSPEGFSNEIATEDGNRPYDRDTMEFTD